MKFITRVFAFLRRPKFKEESCDSVQIEDIQTTAIIAASGFITIHFIIWMYYRFWAERSIPGINNYFFYYLLDLGKNATPYIVMCDLVYLLTFMFKIIAFTLFVKWLLPSLSFLFDSPQKAHDIARAFAGTAMVIFVNNIFSFIFSTWAFFIVNGLFAFTNSAMPMIVYILSFQINLLRDGASDIKKQGHG